MMHTWPAAQIITYTSVVIYIACNTTQSRCFKDQAHFPSTKPFLPLHGDHRNVLKIATDLQKVLLES